MTELFPGATAADLLAALAAAFLRANLAMGAAILLVVALRAPVRRLQGPAAAYLLWWAPVVAALLTPLSGLLGDLPDPLAATFARRPDLLQAAVMAWAAGVAV